MLYIDTLEYAMVYIALYNDKNVRKFPSFNSKDIQKRL